MSKFKVQVDFDDHNRADATVYFPQPNGVWSAPMGSDPKYWSQAMKDALGLHQADKGLRGFPYQLSPKSNLNAALPIPTVEFGTQAHQSTLPSIGETFSKEQKIYVTPTDYFKVKYKNIFIDTVIGFSTAKYGRKWLRGPQMQFWPQQLNFALWCATTGCGVSRDILFQSTGDSYSDLDLSPQLRAFYLFHVYYTTRRILYEMGGIASSNALPGDPAYKQVDNPYNIAAYRKICGEFGIDPTTDFRYTYGKNHGLGTVYIEVTGEGPSPTDYSYPDQDLALFDDERITDIHDPNYKANGISFVRNDQGADKQFEYFVPNYAQGFTAAGLGRLNDSIEAFGYCILGAQANTLTSIVGLTGGAKNAQNVFHTLLESTIVTNDISQRVQRYQSAITATKVRLNLAVAKGVWLLPARMVINTESVVGYNNNLLTADPAKGVKLGVNNDVNQDTKKAALQHADGGPSKINPPNSHPWNPIHKEATRAQGIAKAPPRIHTPSTPGPTDATQRQAAVATPAPDVEPHHVNKALVAVGALALAGFVALMR